MAAAVSATIGELSKPFTSAIRGNGFNLKSVIRSGGMPSTHSAVRFSFSFDFLLIFFF